MIKAFFDVDMHDPRQIEDNGQVIGDDTLEKMLLIITNAEEGISKLKIYRFRDYRNCSNKFQSQKGKVGKAHLKRNRTRIKIIYTNTCKLLYHMIQNNSKKCKVYLNHSQI
jgi:hypothetical protein